MKQRILELVAKIEAMTLRERVLLMAAIITVLFVAWDNIFLGSLEQDRKQLISQVENVEKQIADVDVQIQKVVGRYSVDPDKDNRMRVASLRNEMKAIDGKLKELTLGLIPPTKMSKVLQDVLSEKTSLKLISIQSLPAQPLLVQDAGEKTEKQSARSTGVYRHGLEIKLEGSYLETLSYLRALEDLPWKLYWDTVDFKVINYPKSQTTIVVHTLSLTEGWIGV